MILTLPNLWPSQRTKIAISVPDYYPGCCSLIKIHAFKIGLNYTFHTFTMKCLPTTTSEPINRFLRNSMLVDFF